MYSFRLSAEPVFSTFAPTDVLDSSSYVRPVGLESRGRELLRASQLGILTTSQRRGFAAPSAESTSC